MNVIMEMMCMVSFRYPTFTFCPVLLHSQKKLMVISIAWSKKNTFVIIPTIISMIAGCQTSFHRMLLSGWLIMNA